MTKDEAQFRRSEEESRLLLPDDLHLSSVEDVVAAFAPELKPATLLDWELTLTVFLGLLAVLAVFGGVPDVIGGVVLGSFLVIPALVVRGRLRAREYQRQLNETPGVLFDKIASKFRRQIEAHRRKVLGPDSELGRARAPLVDASDKSGPHPSSRHPEEEGGHLVERTSLLGAGLVRSRFHHREINEHSPVFMISKVA